jgi:hypothetical protein
MTTIELSDDMYNEILRLARLYQREAERCQESKAYLAGCVMIGAAFEASLLAFANCYLEEVLESTATPRRKTEIKPLVDWSLAELLAVAKERNWLPSALSLDDEWNEAKAKIGDYGEVIRQIRNLVHPARFALDWPRKRITKKYLETAFEILDVANEYLFPKLNKSLWEAIEEEEKRKLEDT